MHIAVQGVIGKLFQSFFRILKDKDSLYLNDVFWLIFDDIACWQNMSCYNTDSFEYVLNLCHKNFNAITHSGWRQTPSCDAAMPQDQ